MVKEKNRRSQNCSEPPQNFPEEAIIPQNYREGPSVEKIPSVKKTPSVKRIMFQN